MASSEITAALDEILPFLDVLTPVDYKLKILDYILGMTGTTEGLASLLKNTKLINALVDIIPNDKNDKVRLEALKVLVNLTSGTINDKILTQLTNADFVTFLLRAVLINNTDCSDMIAMLLSNLTQTTANSEVVFKCVQEDKEYVSIKKLVDAFCIEDYNKSCSLHHLGFLFANITVLKDARLMFLKKDDSMLTRLLPFTQYEKSGVRRLAIARVIKNCLFETEYHDWLIEEDNDILTHLLLPLAGPEEFTAEENDELSLDLQYLPPDKQRETNREIVMLLVESLFQLCATKECRLKMKSTGCYYIMRELHKCCDEKDDVLNQMLENIITVLIGDEPDEGLENLRNVEVPSHIADKLNQLST